MVRLSRAAPALIALAAAVGAATVGVALGTYAVGGSDSSCYALMAEAFASGELQPTSALAAQVPWPDASKTFTAGGFLPSETNLAAAAPVCAPGFSLLLAPLVSVGGGDALFFVSPIAAAVLVWTTFLAGRALGGPLAGAMAAVLIAVSPPVLYQVVQPMNDVTTAALWMLTFVSLIHGRWGLAGAMCGLALLVRPNLLPLAVIAMAFVIVVRGRMNPVAVVPGLTSFCLAALPFGVAVLGLNSLLYGSPARTGYGEPAHLFALAHVAVNARRYFGWLLDTHTVFPLLGFAAPVVVPRHRQPGVALALAFVAATCGIYAMYTPFDDWSYLRFLLPAIALMLVLSCTVTVAVVERMMSGFRPTSMTWRSLTEAVVLAALTTVLAMFSVRAAGERQAFALRSLEQRYRSAGVIIRERLPPGAVVFSVWDSGAVRFHGGRDALAWEGLDPAWLDRSVIWLQQQGRSPYFLFESWEEPAFRSRFGSTSDIGKLDWPPKYEIDRKVRLYDPRDRERYHRGEVVDTEFVWPMRR